MDDLMGDVSGPPVCTDPACAHAGKQHYPPCKNTRNPLAAFVASGLVPVQCAECHEPLAKGDLYLIRAGAWLHLRCVAEDVDGLIVILKATAEVNYPNAIAYPLPAGGSLAVKWTPPLRRGRPDRRAIVLATLCYRWGIERPSGGRVMVPTEADVRRALQGWEPAISRAANVFARGDAVLDV